MDAHKFSTTELGNQNQYEYTKTNHRDIALHSISEPSLTTWDAETWKQNFLKAVKNHNYQDIHDLRISVYQNTLLAVKNQGYISEQGNFIHLNNSESSILNTKFYDTELNPDFSKVNQFNTKVSVINRDCLVLAKELVKETDEDICVLNLANRQNPGGGVIKGSGAQEEYLFRCSDYFRSLYQFAPYAEQYDITSSVNSYPMDRNYGGIFSPNITIFRGPEEDGYPLLNQPWSVNMIAVAALNRPNLVHINDEERIVPNLINAAKNKIRTIFRIARDNNQTVLILGALGCGAFRNPPKHTAELFKEIIKEREFTGVFRQIYFAIKEDHNSRGIGNFTPFKEVFRDFES